MKIYGLVDYVRFRNDERARKIHQFQRVETVVLGLSVTHPNTIISLFDLLLLVVSGSKTTAHSQTFFAN